jgi:5-methylcytosine-specific restriction protein A
MLKRFCLKQGCSTIVDTGYCESHTPEKHAYDNYRGTAAERGYDSRWQKYSRLYRKKNPLCVMCLDKGLIVPSQHVDHIIAVKGANDPLFYKESNHQALCAPCHSRKTIEVDGGFGNGHK